MEKYEKKPLAITLNAPQGAYDVTVNIEAHSDTVLTIYSQHRSFVVRDRVMRAGEKAEFKFIVDVFDRKFDGAQYESVTQIKIEIACDGDITATAMATPEEVPTVFVCGDSTVTDQPAEYPYSPVSTYCGWGQAFGMLTHGIAIANHAQSGSCTKAFMASNLTAFEDKIKSGDYMVIEFGHNDQKLEELDAYGGYKANLIRLAKIALSKGARPIICSPINRIIFEPDGSLKNLLGDYRNAAKEAADEVGADFIDMWQMTTDFFVTAGPVKSWGFFRCLGEEKDYTHTNDIGGTLVANLFADAAVRQNIALAKYIDRDKISVERVYADPQDKPDNEEVLTHVKSIGLVNIPEDFDADITGLQI